MRALDGFGEVSFDLIPVRLCPEVLKFDLLKTNNYFSN